MIHFITNALDHYGYIILFAALLLELLALPLPGELLMSYVGFLVYEGKLNWVLSIIVGGFAASIGMTLAYWIGFRLGTPFINKYGKRVHMGPERMEKLSLWFATYGNKLFVITYFIPGVRHVTGYFAGVTRIPFRTFALYSYGGAFFWTFTFISLGKLLGPKWEKFHTVVSRYMVVGTIGFIVLLIIIYVFRRYKQVINQSLNQIVHRSIMGFHSLGRVKIAVALMGIVCLALIIFSMGLIQDFMGSEFDEFNTVAGVIADSLQEEGWFFASKYAHYLVSSFTVILVSVSLTVWVFVKSQQRILDLSALLFILVGGDLWGELLQKVFHQIGPSAPTDLLQLSEISFPSEPSLTAIILYGCATYMVFRHIKLAWLKTIAGPLFMIILLFIGLGLLIYERQVPSDIIAGFALGGVWVTLQFILLEVFRVIKKEAAPQASISS